MTEEAVVEEKIEEDSAGQEVDGCPLGMVEGTDITKCEMDGFKHLTNNLCKDLVDTEIDCNQLYKDVKSGKISKDEFKAKIISAIDSKVQSGDITTEDVQKGIQSIAGEAKKAIAEMEI